MGKAMERIIGMRLLIVTQVVDQDDPVLGFFTAWIEELAKKTEQVEIICLKMGQADVPKNARLYSLGKPYSAEATKSTGTRIRYAVRFLKLVWRLRHDYDAVFVHMNQEYVLLAGWLWRLLGKRIYLWRNHYAGSWLTDVAAAFCTCVFCTSKHSYTAKYKKTIRMPVGVDTERFKPDERVKRISHSILFLARMSPSKRPDMLLDALTQLARDGIKFTANFVGSPLPSDESYYEGLVGRAVTLGFDGKVTFLPAVTKESAPRIFCSHEIFVNTSPSGMLDKTIFEAAACGCTVLASSDDFALLAGSESHLNSITELAERLSKALANSSGRSLSAVATENSLTRLAEKLVGVIIGKR